MIRRICVLLVLVAATTALSACLPVLAPPPAPTLEPGRLNSIVAQTAAAAATQTAAYVSTATPIPTTTQLITTTPTEIPSLTPTFIFRLATATKPKPTSSGSGSSSDSYDCRVLSHSPGDGTSFSPNTDFDARWQVKNTGLKGWDVNSADYRYLSGDKLGLTNLYDFPKTVYIGGRVDLTVHMRAPGKAGTYSTTWQIHIGHDHFCNMQITIEVK
jgi:hypothetical protein